nr:hypothetical protein [Tanacetum cinerariifolium]
MTCQIVKKKLEEKRIEEEQAATAQNRKIPVCYDDDDEEEESNSLKDNNISELPPCSAVTPSEPIDSLSMGDEHLDTISATKSDEVIKSCVENLVPNPKSMLNRDSSIISSSSKIDSLLDEFVDELTLLKSIPPGIDKTDCHPENEIRLSQRLLNRFIPYSDDPMPPSIEDDDDSEGDILFLEILLHDDPVPLQDIPDFSYEVSIFLPFFTYPVTSHVLLSSGSKDKIFDPGITVNHFYSFHPSLSHRHGAFKKFNTHRSHLNEWPMIINGKNTPLLDVLLDDQSCSDEDVLEKIISKSLSEEEIIPTEFLRTHDSSLLILSKFDSLLDEFAGELPLLKSILPRIDKTGCDFEEDIRVIEKLLYDNSSPRPPEEFVSVNSNAAIKSFSPSPILVKDSDSLIEEIDLFCTPDYPMPPGIVDKDYESEKDILIRKDLPSNNTLSFAEKESFHFDIPSFSRPPAKPPDGDTRILNIKMMGDISDQKAFMHKLMVTPASHQETSPDLLSHRCGTVKKINTYRSHLNKCPMLFHGQNNPPLDVLLFHFYPP